MIDELNVHSYKACLNSLLEDAKLKVVIKLSDEQRGMFGCFSEPLVPVVDI